MLKMFDLMTHNMDKHELRYLMRKFRFPTEKMEELEATYHGKDNLKERIYNAMLAWKELKGPQASGEELIRILHIIGLEDLSQKLHAVRIYSQVMKL